MNGIQIEKPLQRHGGRLEHNETYCGSCYGAEVVCSSQNWILPVLVGFRCHLCHYDHRY